MRFRILFGAAAVVAALVVIGAVFVASAGAYGGGASHDTWQVAQSFNCDNPSFCGNDLGGFWGWVELDRYADGSITGDAEFAGCGHSVGGGGPGSAGAGHVRIDITAAHIEPAGPNDPNPGGNVFYIDHNVVTFIGHGGSQTVVDDPDFLGDSNIPTEAGHYSYHPAPGAADMINVSFRPAR